jgi:hypothetical protein
VKKPEIKAIKPMRLFYLISKPSKIPVPKELVLQINSLESLFKLK